METEVTPLSQRLGKVEAILKEANTQLSDVLVALRGEEMVKDTAAVAELDVHRGVVGETLVSVERKTQRYMELVEELSKLI